MVKMADEADYNFLFFGRWDWNSDSPKLWSIKTVETGTYSLGCQRELFNEPWRTKQLLEVLYIAVCNLKDAIVGTNDAVGC